MSDEPNINQNTPSYDDLNAQIAADEAARVESAPAPEPVVEEPVAKEPEQPQETEESPETETEFEKRIARMAYEKRTAEKHARQLQERLDRLEGKAPALAQDKEEDDRVQRRAEQLAQEARYNDKANAIYRAGVEAFPDFDLKLGGLRDIGGISPAVVEAAEEVGDAHKIIYWLGKNPDEAERILALPPHRLGAALGKIASKANPPPPAQSKAPPPIRPITGHVRAEQSIENMPLDEFMRREDERWAQVKARR